MNKIGQLIMPEVCERREWYLALCFPPWAAQWNRQGSLQNAERGPHLKDLDFIGLRGAAWELGIF